ncbi:serine hydrolase [Prevotella sp. A2931]|uniref:Serine hydrolase n=2 Tax=Prevotellaceae TaxID=171552 RepID=A0ABS3M893_9BACT|nr:serine hydrolase [Prevotella illustrans]
MHPTFSTHHHHSSSIIRPVAVLCFLFSLLTADAQVDDLPRTRPETVGIPSAAVDRLMDSLMALPRTAIHSLIVMRHGQVAYESYPAPFRAESMHTMYSCSKTFVAAAVGIAISERRLNTDSRVADFFPMDHRNAANYRQMTVRDLLTMASGITPDWDFRNMEPQWTSYWLSKTIDRPGRKFRYDSMCTYLLSAILQKVTGQTLLEYLKPRLFEPLHITRVEWEKSPEGIDTGGWGLYIQAESLAKFGQLLLQGGRWRGRQLIPEAWVKEMMKKQIDNGGPGYGYQMWRCEYPGAVRADGAYGQYILVVPDKDMVVVITECSAINGTRQRRLVWRELLPLVVDTQLPLPHEKKPVQRLLPTPEGSKRAPKRMPRQLAIGLKPNVYAWSEVAVERTGSSVTFSYVQEGRRVSLPMTYGRWNTITTSVTPVYSVRAKDRFKGISGPFTLAGSYAFAPDGTLHIRLHYTDWITLLDITIGNLDTSQPTVGTLDTFHPTVALRENHAEQPLHLEQPVRENP